MSEKYKQPTDPADPSSTDPKISKMWDDVNAVFLDRTKKITDFPPEYQEILRNTYRFSATFYNSKYGWKALRTKDTLDIV
jgi:hypothetical protein